MDITYTRYPIVQTTGATTVMKAAVAGQVARLLRLVVALATAGTIQVQDTDGTALTGLINLAAGTPLVIDRDEILELNLTSASGKGLQIVTTQAACGVAFISNAQA